MPPERIYIHAGRPANLEFRRGRSGPGGYSLYIDAAPYRSPDALKMAPAHELTHLHARIGYIGQLGYLPVPSFAYLYRRVNELVKVPERIACDGLNSAARSALASG